MKLNDNDKLYVWIRAIIDWLISYIQPVLQLMKWLIFCNQWGMERTTYMPLTPAQFRSPF